MSNLAATYTLLLNSQVKQQLQETEMQALSLDRTMDRLNGTMTSVAAAFLAHQAFRIGKDAIEDVAEYENAVYRIKFASDSLVEGANNIKFISDEVDKFKIPLQSATDDYGKFLAMLSGSDLASDEVRKLHDNILMIGKIKHLDPGQLSAGVMNLGKMLEAGAMDARHLRPLEMQLSGIGKFIADELGVSVHELAKLRNKGKLTDLDPAILIHAIEKQAQSLEHFLPESLTSIQSYMNELGNDWLKLKTDIILEIKPALIDLFGTMRDGIIFLKEHKEQVIHIGKALGVLTIGYYGLKTALFLTSGVQALINIAVATGATNQMRAVSTTQLQTSAILELVAAMEALVAAQSQAAVTANVLYNAQGQVIMSSSLQAEVNATQAGLLAAQGGAMATKGAASFMAGAGSLISKGVLWVGLAYITKEVLESLGVFGKTTNGRDKTFADWIGISDWALKSDEANVHFGGGFDKRQNEEVENKKKSWMNGFPYKFYDDGKMPSFEEAYPFSVRNNKSKYTNGIFSGVTGGTGFPSDFSKSESLNSKGKNLPYSPKIDETNKIRGNSVTNINIHINELNGQKNCTFEVKNGKDYEDLKDRIGIELTQVLSGVVNDSQIVAGK